MQIDLCIVKRYMKQFSIEEAVRFGWQTTKTNFKFLIKIILIIMAAYILTSWVSNALEDAPVLNVVASILFWVLHIVLDIGLVKIALKLTADQKPELADLFNHYPLFWKYLGGAILSGLIILGGLILLIVPGIYFAVKLQFVTYLIIDQGLGPIDAIKKSWEITGGNFWNLFLFGLVIVLINVLGFLALVVGLLWAIPTAAIATAFVYKKLLKN